MTKNRFVFSLISQTNQMFEIRAWREGTGHVDLVENWLIDYSLKVPIGQSWSNITNPLTKNVGKIHLQ